ncbi:hypothetical protein AB0N28_02055 [Streptomyces sp. NPDC051130]|uniref:hypothetical protein n=1 Tax=Streptomyces sp. NPDC051130 TaxID=3157223 RepID=UPI00343EA35E
MLVFARGDDEWRLYDCGMVEFLLRIVRAEFPSNPLSGTPMWGAPTPKFLTYEEERRIAATGRDPWA